MSNETATDAWRQRFGSDPAALPEELAPLLRHRSVRRYADTPVPEELVACLIGVAQSASTSSNLQSWSVVSVQDPERRARVAALCADQKQVHRAPWFLAFFADWSRLATVAAAVGEECLGLDYNEYFTMAVIDAALAAERLVCAAETLGLGACYIGALRNDPDGIKKELAVPERCVGLFGLCLGWPDETRPAPIKPRLDSNVVWYRETFPAEPEIGDYDARMKVFTESQNIADPDPWTKKSGKRVDEHHLTGRERLRSFLDRQGLDKR